MIKTLSIIAILLQINGTALAQNETLLRVAYNRQDETRKDIIHKIDNKVDPASYECRIALPTRYYRLVGSEVYFAEDNGNTYGPWLVTDFQDPVDESTAPMEASNLLADVDCPGMYHKKGKLVVVISDLHNGIP